VQGLSYCIAAVGVVQKESECLCPLGELLGMLAVQPLTQLAAELVVVRALLGML
jgi:hypothetical protein